MCLECNSFCFIAHFIETRDYCGIPTKPWFHPYCSRYLILDYWICCKNYFIVSKNSTGKQLVRSVSCWKCIFRGQTDRKASLLRKVSKSDIWTFWDYLWDNFDQIWQKCVVWYVFTNFAVFSIFLSILPPIFLHFWLKWAIFSAFDFLKFFALYSKYITSKMYKGAKNLPF